MKKLGLALLLILFFIGGCGQNVKKQEKETAIKTVQALPNCQQVMLYFSLDDDGIRLTEPARVYNFSFATPEKLESVRLFVKHTVVFRDKDNSLWLAMLQSTNEVIFLKKIS